MIKAIIFDLWNTIIIGNKNDKLSGDLAKKLDSINFDTNHFFLFGHKKWMMDGKGIEENYFEEYCELIGVKKININILKEYICELKNVKPIRGIPKLIKSLKENYKLGLISNAGLTGKSKFEELKISKYFEATTYSFLERVVKPNPNIYCKALGKLGVSPHEAIFIDDVEEFAEGARYLGMRTILFNNTKDLIKELKEWEIKV